MLAAFVGDPAALTSRQMDRWANAFDSWAICDTVCFALFDRTPLAWSRVNAWTRARGEFKKRAAFALLWGLSVHDKTAPESRFATVLPLIAAGAEDERDYVKKGVDMALRAIGKRSKPLQRAALDLAATLSASERATPAGICRNVLRDLNKARKAR